MLGLSSNTGPPDGPNGDTGSRMTRFDAGLVINGDFGESGFPAVVNG